MHKDCKGTTKDDCLYCDLDCDGIDQPCKHKWDETISSMSTNEHFIEVKCKKCGVYGEEDRKTGEVTWPVT